MRVEGPPPLPLCGDMVLIPYARHSRYICFSAILPLSFKVFSNQHLSGFTIEFSILVEHRRPYSYRSCGTEPLFWRICRGSGKVVE